MAAMEALILVAETGGPTMFAQIGMMRAINHHQRPAHEPQRRPAEAHRIVG
jgi:hypothetical protein